MKNVLRVFMLVTMMAVCSVGMYAQKQDAGRQRLSREELAKVQARHIAGEMAFDNAVTERFVETYCRCQSEIWALGGKRGKGERKVSETTTEEETAKELSMRFERRRKILDIRQKYYEEYSKFLTQKQIKRVYELENGMMNRLAKRGKGNARGRRR